MDEHLTPSQIKRRQNKAIRDAARAQREAEEKADKALMLEVVRDALKDKTATTAQRLFALAVLNNLKYYHYVPSDTRHLLQTEDAAKIDAEIAERLEQLKNK